jgi:hypothetical protein
VIIVRPVSPLSKTIKYVGVSPVSAVFAAYPGRQLGRCGAITQALGPVRGHIWAMRCDNAGTRPEMCAETGVEPAAG